MNPSARAKTGSVPKIGAARLGKARNNNSNRADWPARGQVKSKKKFGQKRKDQEKKKKVDGLHARKSFVRGLAHLFSWSGAASGKGGGITLNFNKPRVRRPQCKALVE